MEQRILVVANRGGSVPVYLRFLASALLWLAGVSTAVPGVVIVQKTTAPDGKGGTKVTTVTTLIEGNKQKTTTDRGDMILDLDKGTMVNLNPTAKTATELSLKQKDGPGAMMTAGMLSSLNASFKPTGAHKTVAGYKCDEYTGNGKFMVEFTMTSCFSKDAPGSAEYEKFNRKMLETFGAKDAAAMPAGIVLANEMIMQPMMSAESIAKMAGSLPPEAVKQMAEAAKPQRTVTEVTSVKSESVPAENFAIPAGYTTQQMDPGAKKR